MAKESVELAESVEELAHKPITSITPLTTPCSVTALHNWIIGILAVSPGDYPNTTVSSTATSLTVA